MHYIVCPGGLTHSFHSKTAGQVTLKTKSAPKFLAAGALPRTPLGKLTALRLCGTPGLVGRGGKPLSKNPQGAHTQLFGLRVSALWVSPRPRNVDFVPTPLPGCHDR